MLFADNKAERFVKVCLLYIYIYIYIYIATTDIQEAAVAGRATSWHQKSMEAGASIRRQDWGAQTWRASGGRSGVQGQSPRWGQSPQKLKDITELNLNYEYNYIDVY